MQHTPEIWPIEYTSTKMQVPNAQATVSRKPLLIEGRYVWSATGMPLSASNRARSCVTCTYLQPTTVPTLMPVPGVGYDGLRNGGVYVQKCDED